MYNHRLFGWPKRIWRWFTTKRRPKLQLDLADPLADPLADRLADRLADTLLMDIDFAKIIDAFWLTARSTFKPVAIQYYGHGAFMGAAPALLADPQWRRILAFLMPDVFTALEQRIQQGADASQLIPMLENNPVVAAYGTKRSATLSSQLDSPNHLAGMEWDVFVDSALIAQWEAAEDESSKTKVMNAVLDTTMIAHGSSVDLIQESMGVCQYADVRRTPKTHFGGVEMDAWLDFYGRALFLSRHPDFDAAVKQMSAEPRSTRPEAAMIGTFALLWTVPTVVALHREVSKRELLSIIIDIKSLDSTPPFLSALVQHLNRLGLHVAAVGSFNRAETLGLSAHVQHVGDHTLPGPREVWFFHYAGDLQAVCEAGLVERGQSVMFNGASVIAHTTSVEGLHAYTACEDILVELEIWREYLCLEVGLYVQEGDCDAGAAAALSEIIDTWPQTFSLGFAWGGLRDEAGLPSGPKPKLGYGSQRMLGYLGKAKHWQLRRPATVTATTLSRSPKRVPDLLT